MTATTLPPPVRGTAGGTLAGMATLLRFMLRRDRVRFPAWTLGVALLMGYFTTALNSVYSTTEQLESQPVRLTAVARTGSPDFLPPSWTLAGSTTV